MVIKSVAIIGGGPSGIASLYDLTRTLKNGDSLFRSKDVSFYEQAGQLAFDNVILFERNSSVGGAWSDSVIGKSIDPRLPDFGQLQADSLNYNEAKNIFNKPPIPEGIENSSFENPVIVETEEDPDKYQWHGTGVYGGLFTNIPAKYMSFSFDEYDYKRVAKKFTKLKVLQPATDVGTYLKKVTERNNLTKNIRLNSNVENVRKLDSGKWVVTIREKILTNNLNFRGSAKIVNRWYQELFDAVIIGNGKTIPHLPAFKNLGVFVAKNASKSKEEQALITHAKSISNPVFLQKSKKILFVGSSVSAADLLQYAFPRKYEPASVFVSRKSAFGQRSEWIDFACYSSGIVNKPVIKQFLPEINGVEFGDGTIEKDFDVIIFATGYHMHYPFIDESFFKKHGEKVTQFYKYTFSLADPTLALVGNTYAAFFFNRVESQAAALAGTWGGFSKLPSEEEQKHWIETSQTTGKLTFFSIQTNFIDPLMKYAVSNRPSPFASNERFDHVRDLSEAKRIIEELFFGLKEGKYTPEELFHYGPGFAAENFEQGFIDNLSIPTPPSTASSSLSLLTQRLDVQDDEQTSISSQSDGKQFDLI